MKKVDVEKVNRFFGPQTLSLHKNLQNPFSVIEGYGCLYPYPFDKTDESIIETLNQNGLVFL